MIEGIYKILSALFLVLLVAPATSWAVCAKVSIEIPQELTLERIAFDAKMVITNNVPDKDLTNVRVDVTIRDADGNGKNELFFVKVLSSRNVGDVNGTGTVRAATTAEIHWLIIPSPGAGGSTPAGINYWVGATLSYVAEGKEEIVSVNPDKITVRPEAQLILDYFVPYEVIGDNPFTPAVEAPVPFPLAVRVMNAGYGPANKLKINSAQPKIVDNAQGLLVDFKLLGTAINDSAVSPSLLVDIGTLPSKKIATAYWEMISTLTGRFIEFGVTFSHASDLGGELTSLIRETNAYYLSHRVKVNLPGRDSRLDFLADVDKDAEHLPDMIFESEIPGGSENIEDARSPVTVVAVMKEPGRPTPQVPDVTMEVATGDPGWVYARVPDPSRGMLKLQDVIRADGVRLDPNNFWISEGLDKNQQRAFTLHILDYRAGAGSPGIYTLKFAQPAEDMIPPSTTLIFSGPSSGTDPVYITPETTIIFNALDNAGGSGVGSMLRKVVGTDPDFVPAFPVQIESLGGKELEYYSIDRAGNQEPVKTTHLFVDNKAPKVESFQAVPSTFMPHAPRGVSAVRTMNFVLKATDEKNSLKATIDIAGGAVFSVSNIVKTFTTTITSDIEAKVLWNGRDKNDALVPTGIYTARLKVTDGLEGGPVSHTVTREVHVTVAEWFKSEALDPNLSGSQQYPEISGTRVVWQDMRNGNWDIYTKDIFGGPSLAVTSNTADQTRPSISGNIIVWQDMRNGNWDIYGYDLATETEFIICSERGNQERPVISGQWVAWQDDRAGDYDIYAYNLNTFEQVRITSHERNQLHPAISGNILTWEDYRHGLGDIYKYDLHARAETRITYHVYNQTLPSASGTTISWTDQRDGQRDIYYYSQGGTETRATYGTWDHSQSALLNEVFVYVDYASGQDDPNLAFFDIKTGIGDLLSVNTAKQEEPAMGSGVLAWQDDRDGIYQIYWANFQIEALPMEVEVRPGFNLIAVGDRLARVYPSASQLIAASPVDLGVEKVVTYLSLNGTFVETSLDMSNGSDILLGKGMAIGVYASGNGMLDIGDSGETSQYSLLPGVNYIGMLMVSSGYTAYDLLAAIGLDNVRSARKFNNLIGAWETASVIQTSAGKKAVGVNFPIHQGDGLIITMERRVDGWKP